jgi:hypothetical protein
MNHFEGHFEGPRLFDPLNCPERSEGQFRGQKSRQRDINSYKCFVKLLKSIFVCTHWYRTCSKN